VVNNWSVNTYNITTYNVSLNGTYDLVIEYFDDNSANRVSFSMMQNIVLAVDLVSFTAKQWQNRNELEWVVSPSSDPKSFLVEKSIDGSRFTGIGTVEASSATMYSFADASISGATTFYRLKMISKNGIQTYSDIVTIRTAQQGDVKIRLYPTIVSGSRIFVESSVDLPESVVIITDMSGRRIKRSVLGKMITGGKYPVELSQDKMPAGLYLAEVISQNERQSAVRFIIR
jgi:hypothetical protein